MCSFVSRFKTGLAKILSYKSFSLHVSELQWHFSDKKLLKTNKQTLYQLNLLQSEQSIIKSISCSRVFVINKSPTLWTIDFSHVHMYFRLSCFWALPIWDTYLLILSRPRQHISTKYIDSTTAEWWNIVLKTRVFFIQMLLCTSNIGNLFYHILQIKAT